MFVKVRRELNPFDPATPQFNCGRDECIKAEAASGRN